MLPWWFWLVLWTVLLLLLLAALVALAWRLAKKFLTVLGDLGSLTEKLSLLEPAEPGEEPARVPVAVLRPLTEVQNDYRDRMLRRAERAQMRRENRHNRGKRIIAVDASTAEWPAGWRRP